MDVAHAFWPRFYRLIAQFDPQTERVWRRFGLGNLVLVTLVGRRSGEPRTQFLGILCVGDDRYLGHPDVACTWTNNLDAAGGGELEWRDGRRERFAARLLEPGPERSAAIRATFRQHPFPGGLLYWLGRRHVEEVGRFYRLTEPDA